MGQRKSASASVLSPSLRSWSFQTAVLCVCVRLWPRAVARILAFPGDSFENLPPARGPAAHRLRERPPCPRPSRRSPRPPQPRRAAPRLPVSRRLLLSLRHPSISIIAGTIRWHRVSRPVVGKPTLVALDVGVRCRPGAKCFSGWTALRNDVGDRASACCELACGCTVPIADPSHPLILPRRGPLHRSLMPSLSSSRRPTGSNESRVSLFTAYRTY